MKILVTGAAGFIGFHTIRELLKKGESVVGIDNLNDYYAVELKKDRLVAIGEDPNFKFIRIDLADRTAMEHLFATEQFDAVINLGGQAGVRYSLENPYAYVESNVVGFLNLLENCRHYPVKHLVYASSSSIYGLNTHTPSSETDQTDTPVSLYAATKKSDELMAHAYSKLYQIPTTGIRFFTVYGPWGRPDMAPFLFTKSILEGKTIRVFNHGELERDFTYIDDIVAGILRILDHPSSDAIPYRIYNIGHSKPVKLMDFIHTIEKVTGREACKEMVAMQPGDVYTTYADTTRLETELGYRPQVGIEEGITRFYEWYRSYYKIQ